MCETDSSNLFPADNLSVQAAPCSEDELSYTLLLCFLCPADLAKKLCICSPTLVNSPSSETISVLN